MWRNLASQGFEVREWKVRSNGGLYFDDLKKLVDRTVRLLKENGQNDIWVTVAQKGMYPQYNEFVNTMKGNDLGCLLGCEELKGNVWLYGDVYYSDNAIKTILNGTTNYILSEMENKSLSFGEALLQAQSLGFAEQDPTNDIKGIDARFKLIIITYLITGQWITPQKISLECIDHLERADFEYAERMGRRIKLIANLKFNNQGIEIYVLPLMIEQDDICLLYTSPSPRDS